MPLTPSSMAMSKETLAAAKVFFPIGERGVNCAEGNKHSFAMLLALLGQPGVDTADVVMQEGVEAAGPGLHHAPGFQFFDELRRFIAGQSTPGPAGEID